MISYLCIFTKKHCIKTKNDKFLASKHLNFRDYWGFLLTTSIDYWILVTTMKDPREYWNVILLTILSLLPDVVPNT